MIMIMIWTNLLTLCLEYLVSCCVKVATHWIVFDVVPTQTSLATLYYGLGLCISSDLSVGLSWPSLPIISILRWLFIMINLSPLPRYSKTHTHLTGQHSFFSSHNIMSSYTGLQQRLQRSRKSPEFKTNNN